MKNQIEETGNETLARFKMYEYKALVKKVYDGDTITCDIDLGFDIIMKNQKIRLARINTPEVRGKERAEGIISRDILRGKIGSKWIIIKTKQDKKGKYGRWIAEIILDDININDWLLLEGYAKEYGK